MLLHFSSSSSVLSLSLSRFFIYFFCTFDYDYLGNQLYHSGAWTVNYHFKLAPQSLNKGTHSFTKKHKHQRE